MSRNIKWNVETAPTAIDSWQTLPNPLHRNRMPGVVYPNQMWNKVPHAAIVQCRRPPPGEGLGGDLRQQDEFANVGALTARKTTCFAMFNMVTHHGCTMQNLGVDHCPKPMDRTEVLHVQNYDIEDKRKNILSENESVLPCEIFICPSKKYT